MKQTSVRLRNGHNIGDTHWIMWLCIRLVFIRRACYGICFISKVYMSFMWFDCRDALPKKKKDFSSRLTFSTARFVGKILVMTMFWTLYLYWRDKRVWRGTKLEIVKSLTLTFSSPPLLLSHVNTVLSHSRRYHPFQHYRPPPPTCPYKNFSSSPFSAIVITLHHCGRHLF